MQENKNIIFSLFFSTTIILVGFYFITNNQLKKIQNEHTKNENNLIEKIDTTKEHIIGPKNAEIFLISYLDLECPSCKKFHNIEKTLIKNYKGKSIAFVYRHFPLYKSLGKREAIHPTAGAEAIATECVAKLSNEKQFWKMVDKIFETSKSDGQYPLENLKKLASNLGVNKTQFQECMSSDEMKQKIDDEYQKAWRKNIKGAPSIYIQTKNGESYILPPNIYKIKKIIDKFLLEN